MSLKATFAAVLKAMHATRGISQKKLAEVSSRTYISKLERGQCCPTLEMITALSEALNVSPLTLIVITLGAQTGEPIEKLVRRIEQEAGELKRSGVLEKLQIPSVDEAPIRRPRPQSRPRNTTSSIQQTELCFAE